MPELTLVRNEPAGRGLRKLTFDRTLADYERPGQFVTVHVEGHKPAYFALASEPGEPVELLIKVHGDTAEVIASMQPGAVVEFSEPIGKGFPVDPTDARPLVVLASGSGLSAVRPLIERELRDGLPRPVTLFYGVFTPEHRPFVDRLEAWSRAGVDVRYVYSEDVPGWEGARGFVQHAAREAGFVRPDVTVVLCGFPQMIEECKILWADAGATDEQLLTNF